MKQNHDNVQLTFHKCTYSCEYTCISEQPQTLSGSYTTVHYMVHTTCYTLQIKSPKINDLFFSQLATYYYCVLHVHNYHHAIIIITYPMQIILLLLVWPESSLQSTALSYNISMVFSLKVFTMYFSLHVTIIGKCICTWTCFHNHMQILNSIKLYMHVAEIVAIKLQQHHVTQYLNMRK